MKKAKNSRHIAFLAMFAFLMNVMLPFFALYGVPQAMAAQSESPLDGMAALFGGKMLICTSDGYVWVDLADFQNGKELPQPHPKYECALCYVSANSLKDSIPIWNAAIAYHRVTQHEFYGIVDDAIAQQSPPFRSPQPRAPPQPT
ncbi:MAG: hypothetical protein ACYYK0_06360 [Candidatus Eutrophobiaceae bacterium]